MDAGVVLLAGGMNRRMGAEKWLLPVGGAPVLGRLARAFAHAEELSVALPYGADEALRLRALAAVGGAGLRSPARWLTDREADAGPLAGVEEGLAHSRCGFVAVAAADMPFARPELMEALLRLCRETGADAALPERGGRTHPLFAVYRAQTVEKLRAYRHRGGRKVMEWAASLNAVLLPEAETAKYDPHGLALFNMNTPDDYERAKQAAIDEMGRP